MTERTNDEWLAALATTGSARNEALQDLGEILADGLRRGLLHRVNTPIPEFDAQAKDFVQEALLKILDNLDSFAGNSKFTTWAHKIAVHVALTELRRKRWQDKSLEQITDRAEGIYTPGFIADPAPTPEDAATRNEMLRRVDRIIQEELTEKQRTVLTLAVFRQQPAAVVARQMNMKPNAVYKLLHDARLRVKDRLAEEGLSPESVLAVFA